MGRHTTLGLATANDRKELYPNRRDLLIVTAGALTGAALGTIPAQSFAQQQATTPLSSASVAPGHYHPKGKPPSSFTVATQNALRKSMPFDDKLDFEEAKKGFIAAPPYRQIKAEAGHVAWDIGK
jgi:hypothetical protein